MRGRMPAPPARASRPYALPLLALGVAGCAALWVLLALGLQRGQCAWLAPLAALDMLLLQRIARWPAGAGRAAWAVAATALAIALANYGIAAAEVGRNMGLLPWDSALRLGPGYAATLLELANGPAEWAWYALALALAAWGGLSGRRPAPSVR